MDRTDIVLSKILLANSRTPYRDLADKLNLSANAVHQRIQSLIDAGVIRKFTTKISLAALQAITVVIYGVSEAEVLCKVHETLGIHDSVYWVGHAGGNWVYVGGYLRNLSGIEDLVAYIKKEADIPNPIVGIYPQTPSTQPFDVEKTLSSLDRKILFCLANDSRKPIADVAEESGVTAKTVRRRLAAMEKRGLVEFSMDWYPDSSNDVVTIMHIKLNPDFDKTRLLEMMNRYSPNLIFYYPLVNRPNEVFSLFWTSTMQELKEVQLRLTKEAVSSFTSNIVYTGDLFDTWRDELARPDNVSNVDVR